MKYVITGGAGNISKPLIEKLLKAGHDVAVMSRNAEHLKHLTASGAKAAIGSFEDKLFLKSTFNEADAVYTMITPPFNVLDMKAYIEQIGKNYAEAIKGSNIKYVINLSSVGAHLSEGTGPVTGLHRAEKALNELQDVNIIHFRPCYFFTNFFGSISTIKHMNMMGGNFGGENFKLVLAHFNDIADAAFEELSGLKFKGHTIKYIASDEKTTDEIAIILGKAIGKPDLRWVVFTDEQACNGMIQAGFPEEFAKNYAEMGQALQSGSFLEDYWKNRPSVLGSTKLENFASAFASAYNAN